MEKLQAKKFFGLTSIIVITFSLLLTRCRNEPLKLYPYWYVLLYLDGIYPGNVRHVQVMFWADTGEPISCQPVSYGGGSYQEIANTEETETSEQSSFFTQKQDDKSISTYTSIIELVTVIIGAIIGASIIRKKKVHEKIGARGQMIRKIPTQIFFIISLSLLTGLICNVDAVEDSWVTLEPMPTARSGFGAAVVDGKIYVIGGSNGSYLAVNEMYDPETETWTTRAVMPTARLALAIAVYDGKIYVIGGKIGDSSLFSSGYTGVNEVYDPSNDTWETLEPMPTPRSSLCANVVDGKIYLIEGMKYSNIWPFSQVPNVTEVYDPVADFWSTVAAIPTSTSGYASAVVENKIYIFGDPYPQSSATQVYTPETDGWSFGTPVPSEVMFSAAGATTGELAPKRIYVMGGNYGANVAANFNQVYNPDTDSWTTGTPMPTPRYGLGVVVVNDEIYAIGGRTEETYLSVNEKYTPAGYIPEFHSWTPILLLFITFTIVVAICKRKISKPIC